MAYDEQSQRNPKPVKAKRFDFGAALAVGMSLGIITDLSVKTFLGRGSGESIQLHFQGDGWVVLQPYEEVYAQVGQG